MAEGLPATVTCRGVLTSMGEGPGPFLDALIEGRSGLARGRRSTPECYRNPIAYELPLPDPLVPDRSGLPRATAMGLRVARAALAEAGTDGAALGPAHRVGLVVASALLALRGAENRTLEGRVDGTLLHGFAPGATLTEALGFGGPYVTLAEESARIRRARASADWHLAWLNAELQGRDWLAGEFSVADVAFDCFLRTLFRYYPIPRELRALRAWMGRLECRPSWRYARSIPMVPRRRRMLRPMCCEGCGLPPFEGSGSVAAANASAADR